MPAGRLYPWRTGWQKSHPGPRATCLFGCAWEVAFTASCVVPELLDSDDFSRRYYHASPAGRTVITGMEGQVVGAGLGAGTIEQEMDRRRAKRAANRREAGR